MLRKFIFDLSAFSLDFSRTNGSDSIAVAFDEVEEAISIEDRGGNVSSLFLAAGMPHSAHKWRCLCTESKRY